MEWKANGRGNGETLWDKGYTFGSVLDLSKFGKAGFEAELYTGKGGSKGLREFASRAAAKAYVESGAAAERGKTKATDSAGDYVVTWTDRNYKDQRRVFKNDAQGAAGNAEAKAREFARKLESDDAKEKYGNIRGKVTVKTTDSARRARLHRALDAALDGRRAKDDDYDKERRKRAAAAGFGWIPTWDLEEFAKAVGLSTNLKNGPLRDLLAERGYTPADLIAKIGNKPSKRPKGMDKEDAPSRPREGRTEMSELKVGDRVVIQAGWGGKGGVAGQDFKRFSIDTPSVVTDLVGSDVYVRPDGDPYKWKVRMQALKAKATDRRARLHRALDRAIDSRKARSRDGPTGNARALEAYRKMQAKKHQALMKVYLANGGTTWLSQNAGKLLGVQSKTAKDAKAQDMTVCPICRKQIPEVVARNLQKEHDAVYPCCSKACFEEYRRRVKRERAKDGRLGQKTEFTERELGNAKDAEQKTCKGCGKLYEPDAGDKGWCKPCQYLGAQIDLGKRNAKDSDPTTLVKGSKINYLGVNYVVVTNEGKYTNSAGATYVDLRVKEIDKITGKGRSEGLLNIRVNDAKDMRTVPSNIKNACIARKARTRDSAPHKFEPMPGNRPNQPCNRCLEFKNHPNHTKPAKDAELRPVGDSERGEYAANNWSAKLLPVSDSERGEYERGDRVSVDRVGGGTVEGPAPRMNGIGGVFLVKMDKGGTLRVHKDRMRRTQEAKDAERCRCEQADCHGPHGCPNPVMAAVKTIYGPYKMCGPCAARLPAEYKATKDSLLPV